MVRVLLLAALAAVVSARMLSSGSAEEGSGSMDGWMEDLPGLMDVADNVADKLEDLISGLKDVAEDMADYLPEAVVDMLDVAEDFRLKVIRLAQKAPKVLMDGVRGSVEVLGHVKDDWLALLLEALQLQEENAALKSLLQQLEDERCSCLPDTWRYSGISVTGVTGFLVTCPPGSGNPMTGQVHSRAR